MMKFLFVLVCLFLGATEIHASLVQDSSDVLDAPVSLTIGISGPLFLSKKTSTVILVYPDGLEREVLTYNHKAIYKAYEKSPGTTLRFNLESISKRLLQSGPFCVYYHSPYVQSDEANRQRFRTELNFTPPLDENRHLVKVRLHAFVLIEGDKYNPRGYVEAVYAD